MAKKVITQLVGDVSTTDYLDANDVIHDKVEQSAVLIASESKLSKLSAYPAGTIAYTAGFKKIWQKGLDGEWEVII